MFRRVIPAIIFALGLTLLPACSLAATAVDQGASAAGLGPATNSGTSTGSSSADSSTLQPAGTSPLQSTTGASSGLTAPDSNVLQAPASDSDTLQVIEGQADGGVHQLSGGNSWTWLWWLIAALIVAGGVVFWRLRRRPAAKPEASAEPEEQPTPSEPIRSQTLTITIARPAAAIFEFALDPANTPKWIDSIIAEEASDQPPKLGTMYKNQNQDGEWTEYEIVGFEPSEHFTMAMSGSPYRVRYTFKPVAEDNKDTTGTDTTELEYREWVEDGELGSLFPAEALQKLKSLLES
jgi:hypothetical protein